MWKTSLQPSLNIWKLELQPSARKCSETVTAAAPPGAGGAGLQPPLGSFPPASPGRGEGLGNVSSRQSRQVALAQWRFLNRLLYYLETLLFSLPFSGFSDSEESTALASQAVEVTQAFQISRLIHFSHFWPHNLVTGKRKGRGNLRRQILELELQSSVTWKPLLWLLSFVFNIT